MAVNLDAIQARADAAMNHEGETDGYVLAQRWYQSAKDVPALVAELRAARDVVEEARGHKDIASCECIQNAIDDYDKVTGEQP